MVIVAGGASARDVCSFVAQIATELDIKTRVCGARGACVFICGTFNFDCMTLCRMEFLPTIPDTPLPRYNRL